MFFCSRIQEGRKERGNWYLGHFCSHLLCHSAFPVCFYFPTYRPVTMAIFSEVLCTAVASEDSLNTSSIIIVCQPPFGLLRSYFIFSRSLCICSAIEVGLDPEEGACENNVAKIYSSRKFRGRAVILVQTSCHKICAHRFISTSFNASQLKGPCRSDGPGETSKKSPYFIIALSKSRESISRVESGRLF